MTAFILNIREYIYTCGSLERVRVFPTALVMTDGVLSIAERARKAKAFILSICECIYAHGGSERVRAFRLLQR